MKHDRTDEERESPAASERTLGPAEKRVKPGRLAMWVTAGSFVASALISLTVLWLAIKAMQWLLFR